MGGEAAPRQVLEQEWWLAALQEPLAEFKPFEGNDWPTTTLPAFEAAWCAAQQSESALQTFDLRLQATRDLFERALTASASDQ